MIHSHGTNRCGIYVRSAATDQTGCKDQRSLCIDYATDRVPEPTFYYYEDDGCSGLDMRRTGLSELLQAAVQKKIDVVVVLDFARLARDGVCLRRIAAKLWESKVPILSARDGKLTPKLLSMITALDPEPKKLSPKLRARAWEWVAEHAAGIEPGELSKDLTYETEETVVQYLKDEVIPDLRKRAREIRKGGKT